MVLIGLHRRKQKLKQLQLTELEVQFEQPKEMQNVDDARDGFENFGRMNQEHVTA